MREVAPQHLTKFLVGPMAVARWIWRDRPELLGRDHIVVAVAAGEYDLVAGGALWALVSAALGKPQGWARIQLVAPEKAKVLLHDLATDFSRRGGVSIVRQDELALMPEAVKAQWDVAFIASAQSCGLAVEIGREDSHLWAVLEGGGSILLGMRYEWEGWISEGATATCEASLTVSENPLCGEIVDGAEKECAYLVAATGGTRPRAWEAFVNELAMLEIVAECVGRFAEAWDHGDGIEDFRTWGMKAVTKASLDKDDLYVALPLGFMERVADGKIHRFENDVRIGTVQTRISEGSRDPDVVPSTTWIGRVWWACTVWKEGLEDEHVNTIGGSLERLGGTTVNQQRLAVTEALTASGMAPERAQFAMEALTGVSPYSPSQDERRLFQVLADAGAEAALSLVRSNGAHANARDEQRRPFVLALGELGLKEAMSEAVALGGDINAVDAGHRPIVVQLAQNCGTEIVERALDLGAHIDAQDPLGWTALSIALVMAKWEMAGMLVDRNASTTLGTSHGRSPRELVSGSYTKRFRELEEMSKAMARAGGVDMVAAIKKRGFANDPAKAPQWLKAKILGSF